MTLASNASDEVHDPDGLDADTVGTKLMVVAARIARLQTELLDDLDQPLTVRQYRIMARMFEGHTTLTVLAKLARRTLPTMSKSVDALVKRGLIRRVPDEHDRRATRLELTADGEDLLHAADDAMTGLRELLCGPIDVEHRRMLLEIFDGIHQRAEHELRW